MYLYCFARSPRAVKEGECLLKTAEGEWIKDSELFISDIPKRADSAVVMFLPEEAAVRLLTDRLCDVKMPVINVSPDGKYAWLLKTFGYNSFEILNRICSILGSRPLSSEDDRADFAPDLKKAAGTLGMTADNEELLDEISDFIKKGGSVNVYSDLDIYLSEPVLDTLSIAPFRFRNNQKREMEQAYISAASDDENYSVFITCNKMPSTENKGKCLLLIPKLIAVGLEFTGRTDPGYARDTVRQILENHSVDTRSVYTVAVTAIAKESDTVMEIAEDLGCYVTSYDSRLLKAIKIPLSPTAYSLTKNTSDMCTAAACVASDNGREIIRRAGGRNGVMLTAMMKKGKIMLTE